MNGSLTELKAIKQPEFHLNRLRRFATISLRFEVAYAPALGHLARRAVVSAYRDCVALGLEDEAQQVLARAVMA